MKILSRQSVRKGDPIFGKLRVGSTVQPLPSESDGQKLKAGATPASPSTLEAEDSLPDALTTRVMKRYNFTREEAEQALKDFGA